MKVNALACSLSIVLLVSSARAAEAPREPAPSVRQYQFESMVAVSRAIVDGCSKRYPALKEKLDASAETYRTRLAQALDALLETEQFRPLKNAKVSREVVENSAANSERLRKDAATVPETQCREAIGEIAMSEEMVRALLTDLLQRRLVERLVPGSNPSRNAQ